MLAMHLVFFFSFFSPSEATHYLDSGHGLVLEEIL